MKYDIIFAGVGGQGIVSVAAMVVEAASREGLNAKQNEVHGMAQRGGAVSCHVRISDKPIWADIIPKGEADYILSTEPMEALRYVEYLSPNGTIITSNQPVKNIAYPDEGEIIARIKKRESSIVVDTAKITSELSNPRVSNIAVLGALLKKMGILQNTIEGSIKKKFAGKGEKVIEANLKALTAGMNP
ncbi:MAG: indolepyruvate oxidoreductase [Deltaproteobacteria bacterium CG11_big_fil_rev_8_21_14_0_20_49_13]|nr:MAG: indolepyruvate oxidoreductase [Deltaproteobacteria bacterium CG11_big_fil_rev_8_21_14_0_20_49_13]